MSRIFIKINVFIYTFHTFMQNLKIQKYLYDMQKKKEDTTHTYVKYSGSSTETNSYLTFITLVMLKL